MFILAEMMGKRSWVFIAVATLVVAISYANVIADEPKVGPNSIDVPEKVSKKEAEPMYDSFLFFPS